jgi:hypothetical protein
MSLVSSWAVIPILIRYWIKGRFTKAVLIGVLIGEMFSVVFILFASDTFLSFSGRFGIGTELTALTWSLFLSFYLIGLIQSGFNGSGLPVSGGDVDYVFTSPVKSRDVFIAKVLMNSLTTVLFAFPPMFVLYLRISRFYESSILLAAIAGLVTSMYFLMGLFLAADVTLSLGKIGRRSSILKSAFIAIVLFISLTPFLSLIDGIPNIVASLIRFLPNGLTAVTSIGLVSGSATPTMLISNFILLLLWLGGLAILGVRLSRTHFYELVHVRQGRRDRRPVLAASSSELNPAGLSVWSVIGRKERIIIKRTKELRALLMNTLFLSGFILIYSLSGSFQSSPVSFLFILYILGSFGSGNGMRWIEKERLWILKTSPIDMRKYVKQIFRARVSPLLLSQTPIIIAIGIFFVATRPIETSLQIIIVLPAALQISALMMGGSMYFAAKYGQSTTDDILETQTQELVDIKRFIYQAIINLALVAPLMALVTSYERVAMFFQGGGAAIPLILMLTLSLAYSWIILNIVLGKAGNSINSREDL